MMEPETMNEQIETRSYSIEEIEIRADKDSRAVTGMGIIFNSESRDLGGFTEIIQPSAIEGVIEKSDVLALLDHNKSKGVLARSIKGKGSLKLTIDKRGVYYSFDAPNYDLGNELLEGIKRGDIKSSSFAFSVSKGQKWEKKADGTYLRTIFQFDEIFDVSPCYREAYQNTTVALRNLDTFKQSDIPPEVKPITVDPVIEPLTIPVKRSDNERYQRQLNYLLKQKNK